MRLEYFTAPWCQPCKVFGPIMDTVTEALEVEMEKINIEEHPERIPANVWGVPVVVMYNGDREISRIIGARPEIDLINWILREGK